MGKARSGSGEGQVAGTVKFVDELSGAKQQGEFLTVLSTVN
jgi:hypothetical protein